MERCRLLSSITGSHKPASRSTPFQFSGISWAISIRRQRRKALHRCLWRSPIEVWQCHRKNSGFYLNASYSKTINDIFGPSCLDRRAVLSCEWSHIVNAITNIDININPIPLSPCSRTTAAPPILESRLRLSHAPLVIHHFHPWASCWVEGAPYCYEYTQHD